MIIGITGTIGAGKGTVVDYLKEKGFAHFAARDFIVKEVLARSLPVNRDSMTTVANDLRHAHGASYIIGELAKQANAEGTRVIVESVRAVGEAELLKKENALLLAVDADQKTRYTRITERGSVTDDIDFDTFVAQETREMQNADPEKQNIAAVMAMADFKIENNGTLEELHYQLDELLAQLTK
jgi:dephospho-CoA kinase